jgi:hypothetical protein
LNPIGHEFDKKKFCQKCSRPNCRCGLELKKLKGRGQPARKVEKKKMDLDFKPQKPTPYYPECIVMDNKQAKLSSFPFPVKNPGSNIGNKFQDENPYLPKRNLITIGDLR